MSCSTEAHVPGPRTGRAAADSSPVVSNQPDTHEALVGVVEKHAGSHFRRPIPAAQQACFAALDQCVREHGGPVILDSGCGVGESTHALASRHPDHLVIGIDKSPARIAQAVDRTAAAKPVIARGDCIDIWRLAAAANWPIAQHYLLYPNPWPKAKHLQRRWHAHAVFPALIALGGELELRTNWSIYAREFELALACLGIATGGVGPVAPGAALTPFERKYRASGHALFRLSCDLRASSRTLTIDRG
ncbi:MAG: tRNA (guanine(46)-N(7))-methyltransferase TrmB [Gammaproteobacteria bacterium]|jgi:tRNA G46 methylase TrmB